MTSRSPSSSPDSATGSGTDPAGLEGPELESAFEAAANRARDLVQRASGEQLLYLYARFKQAKAGMCNTAKPGFIDFEGQRKWEAWKQLGEMTREQAMQEYVTCVHTMDPSGTDTRTALAS